MALLGQRARSLVWLKRDLRLHDHAPLAAAAQGDAAAAAVWIIEPEWLHSPEFHPRQLQFALRCVESLRLRLAARGLPLLVRVGPALQVLEGLWQQGRFDRLLSHEETGPGWTYNRDRAVAHWCRSRSVQWQEWPQHGVVRRLRSRQGWAGRWQSRMDAPMVATPPPEPGWSAWTPAETGECGSLPDVGVLLGEQGLGRLWEAVPVEARTGAHDGGEGPGLRLLQSFLEGRGRGYRKALSSPLSAEDGCSRLSAHLAWGALSLRRVHQATEAAIDTARGAGDAALASGLRGFAGRLRWHCHFMQKLEDEPQIEFRHFARSCDGLRPGEAHPDAPPWTAEHDHLLQAWSSGHTGYPMVDACMRSLNATGWLNFRMRAMLVSFASYHLWLHWRPTGVHLARQFTDFEAGIHWSQMQMQSGTTGINTLRIYSPTKQALEQDPQGAFIRRWVPELAGVPLAALARPWTLDAAQQKAAGCVLGQHYPLPVVEEKQALAQAKDRMYGLRKGAVAQSEADRIQQQHGSRRSGLPQTGPQGARVRHKPPQTEKAPDPQLDLFSTSPPVTGTTTGTAA